jgi:hypothetical protein
MGGHCRLCCRIRVYQLVTSSQKEQELELTPRTDCVLRPKLLCPLWRENLPLHLYHCPARRLHQLLRHGL